MRAIRTDRKEAASRQAESREKRRRPARFVRHVLTAKTCRDISRHNVTFGVTLKKFSLPASPRYTAGAISKRAGVVADIETHLDATVAGRHR